ncbi:NADH dehydrogenase subunit N [Humibacillus xanthopallidus]|uniref:NADH-quinone oxidoreductase subunit N n=1 Tax=Humibacillus xanthopallidus TaxID=412689 RepID=A0A543PN01_9MICO|nr:NADH-quinone oxidoreductase subunit NuoN [Humibacillus xanthopallidus]TQN45465.1 NADH dehydrogenase subunit N [Humibacillus xanthopallidus]
MTAAVLPALSNLSTLPAAFQASEVNYVAVMPLFIVFVTALIGVLVEAFMPRERRHRVQVSVAVGGLLAAAVSIFWASSNLGLTMGLSDGSTNRSLFALAIDGPALFLQGAILLMGILGVLTMAERFGGVGPDAFTPSGASTPGSPVETAATRAGALTSEVFPLTVFAIFGMMLFPTTNDLIGMFVALEVLSLPLYILTGLARRRRLLSQEASLKYFLLGAFSSAFFLFGTALLYGYAGSVYFGDLSSAISTAPLAMNGLLLPGAFLVFVGLLFKVGAVPFHAWTPDVYQGAPTPVTGFMAACTKAAAFGAILRLAYVGLDTARWEWSNALVIVALLTMVVGSVLSVTQTDMKRLLAYSSIAHAGFILVGVLAFDRTGVGAVLFYIVAYGFSTIAAFAIVSLVRQNGAEATHLSQWAGLGKAHPVAASAFAFLMLAFAGIPLTSGFVSKFAVFSAAVGSGATGTVLAVVGVLCSAITVFVYARVIVLMFFSEAPAEKVEVVTPSAMTTFSIAIGTLTTLALGVVPASLLDLADRASQFVR